MVKIDKLDFLSKELIDLSEEQARQLQDALIALGYDLVSDGLVGRNTASAWAEFKASVDLGAPALIGESSIKLLEKKLLDLHATKTINWSEWDCKVSKYFTIGEVTQCDTQRIPTDKQIKLNILALAQKLDLVREEWGSPIGVTSWYRPPAVNKSVGGVPNSQHINGSAADIFPVGKNIYDFQSWLDKYWPLALGYGAKKGFVHLDLRPNRIRWNY